MTPGCTTPGREYKNHCWVQGQISHFDVDQDGTIFTNSAWDEPHAEQAVWGADGSLAGSLDWRGFESGPGGVAVSADYVFALQQAYAHQPTCWGVTRWHRHAAAAGLPAYPPFPAANWTGGGCPGVHPAITNAPIDNTLKLGNATPVHFQSAMKVCNGVLYLVNSNTSTLSAINPATMAVASAVAAPELVGVTDMACGPTPETLFVARGCCLPPCAGCTTVSAISAKTGVVQFDLEGPTRPLEPLAIAFDHVSQTLFVSDKALARNNIRIYTAAGDYAGSFGAAAGVFGPGAPAGSMGSTRFNQVNQVGVDAAGCVTLNSAGAARRGVDLRRFCAPAVSATAQAQAQAARPTTAAGWVGALAAYELAWRREDLGNPMATATVSAANDSIVRRQMYTYAVDWGKVGSATDANASTNAGFWETTATSFNPGAAFSRDDVRNHQNYSSFLSLHSVSRMVDDGKGGQAEVLFQDTYGTYLATYRFDGNIAVPCGMFGWAGDHDGAFFNPHHWPFSSGAPNLGMWLWQDGDGDARMKPAEFTDLTDNNRSAIWHALGTSIDEGGGVWKRATVGGYCARSNHSLQCHGAVDPVSKRCKQSTAWCKRCACTPLNFCNASTCLEPVPVKQYLVHFPMTGMSEHGCPMYATAKAGWWSTDQAWEWPPAPFNETLMGPAKEFPPGSGKYIHTGMCHPDDARSGWCQGRLQYESATDTMFVSDFTNAEPDTHDWPIGESAGSTVCRFDRFRALGPKSVPRPTMCYDLPYWHAKERWDERVWVVFLIQYARLHVRPTGVHRACSGAGEIGLAAAHS